MASRSGDRNVVGVPRVGGQPLTRTVAATEYATTSTLDELMDNVNVAVGTNKTYQSYIPRMSVNVKGRKMTKKELQSRGNQKGQKEGRRVRGIRKTYREKERERKMKEFEKAMRKGHKWREEVAETEEELEQKMKEIDKELEEDEPGIMGMVGKGNGKKYTGAMVMIQISGKQVKALIDSGACETLIARSWVEYLGLKKMIDEDIEAPNDLRGVDGEFLGVKGAILLKMNISGKEVEWRMWVADKMIVPLIIGNDFHDGRSVIDYPRLTWRYEEVDTPMTIERRQRLTGEVGTVISAMKMNVPQYSMIDGVGRIINDGRGEIKERTIEFTGRCWGNAETQTGVSNTYKRKLAGERTHEAVKIRYINTGAVPVKIKKGEIVGHVQGIENIIAAISYEHRETSETSKSYKALSTEKPTTERDKGKEKIREDGDPSANTEVSAVAKGEEKNKELSHQGTYPSSKGSTVLKDGVEREGREEQTGIEGFWPERTSGDIESSPAPSLFQPGDIATLSESGGEHLVMEVLALGAGASPNPCSNLTREGVEGVSAQQPLERVRQSPFVFSGDSLAESEKEVSQARSIGIIISPEEEEEVRREGVKKDTVVHATEEEIDKMIADAQITPKQKQRLKVSLMERREAFAEDVRPAGRAFFEPHKIRLRTEEPIYTPQYRRSVKEDEMLDEMTEDLYKKGVVRKAWTSAYNSPALLVKKKDGKWRSVIDYRRINDVTIKEPYPIPRMDEAFDALTKAKLMTTFDFTWGYWQTPLEEGDKKKTAFTTKSGRWEYNVLPMGITNAAPTFQRNMEAILSGLLWKCSNQMMEEYNTDANSRDIRR